MKETYLKPINDSRLSFYGKAVVLLDEEKDISYLKSYDTIVAEYNHNENKISVYDWYSQTTARHVNEFLQFYGFDKMTKKEMQK